MVWVGQRFLSPGYSDGSNNNRMTGDVEELKSAAPAQNESDRKINAAKERFFNTLQNINKLLETDIHKLNT